MFFYFNKKYSHCQYVDRRATCAQDGFFVIECIYTLGIITSFMVIIMLYLGMTVYWQGQTRAKLLACLHVQDAIEQLWAGDQNMLPTFEQPFTVFCEKIEYPMPKNISGGGGIDIPLICLRVTASWITAEGNGNQITVYTTG